ncbi:dTMP kinase [Lentzea albidocapillata subsp. violacea]|uniref:Thymidylate kinase n=1 Tax=Lentzea albidocapillata subsp. violacea TaxID=128104 RepID=A0A1G9HMC4_9PSEU|nr:MFS transporter [Lentzea albidocapillata]SDL13884.1 dTMP kinase [Lentzea albidocapillata subsp. violacea]
MTEIQDADTPATEAGQAGQAQSSVSTVHRLRSVLAIRPFRRLWLVTYLCSVGDWLSLLALTGLVSEMMKSYQWQSFALSLVVLTQLLPGILFAPIGGVLADKFDRRKVMVICDVLRGSLFISIALIGSPIWLFVANFLVGCCAMLWIPAKESAVPNLLRRPDQVESANQLGLVMTYGISTISGFGLYSLIAGIPAYLNLQGGNLEFNIATIAVVINGLLYFTSAILVATRLPELSGRVSSAPRKEEDGDKPGFGAMFREGLKFAAATPLVRGLVIGMIGAFAAAGVVIATAKLYAQSLLGGASTFGLLFVAVFFGLAVGMATAPRLAQRLAYNRLFGVTIVFAGISLVLVALAPHLWIALLTVALVGACAGVAFLTGLTIVGSQVEDAMRGRTVALIQSLLKIVLFGASAGAPLLVALLQKRQVSVFGHPMEVDATRPVMLGGAAIAIVLGLVAYRQMDDRREEPVLSSLFAAIRGRRHTKGMLIAVEGDTREDTSVQARRLAAALRAEGLDVLLAADPEHDERRLRTMLSSAELAGVRAQALVAAAVRADVVERQVRPALDSGSIVVMERYVDSPLAHFTATSTLEHQELEGLVDWATGRLRPDLTVLLDRPGADAKGIGPEHHWRVQRLLSEMAAADPDRYVVVEAEGDADEVADRVRSSVLPLLAGRKRAVPQAAV